MARRPRIVPQDFNRLTFVSDPQVSPDGAASAFVVTRPKRDRENREYVGNLWLWREGTARALTHRSGRCAIPRWSPDGRHLAFTYRTKEQTRLEVLPVEGGEARTLYAFKKKRELGAFEGLLWHPKGRRLYFLSPSKRVRKGESDVKVVDRPFYKLNEVGYFHDRRKHLYTIGLRGKRPKPLTKGDFDVGTYFLGAFDVSPDGRQIAFVANTTPEADYTFDRDLHLMPAEGGDSRQLTKSPGPIMAVRWSPDGKQLAYIGHDLRRRLATNAGVWLVPAEGGKAERLTREFDRSVGNALNSDARVAAPDASPVWAPDGEAVYVRATDRGACHLYRVGVEGTLTPVTGGEISVEGFSLSSDHSVLAYAAMTATRPADVYLRGEDGDRRITRFNDRLLERLRPRTPQPFAVTASDGAPIEGWILRSGRGTRPGVLEIHGGPRTTYGHAFMLEFQLLAAHGFDVVYTNPRGSLGYGEGFAAWIVGDYGNRDYADLMEAADHVVEEGWVDPERFGVTGGSYGGFMTNWIVTHTGRFAAAATQRSISNWQSFFGTSDIGYFFGEEELEALPWDDPQVFAEKSPITYVENVTTPLLIIHSEKDYRCPMEQAEQLFVALKRLKKEVRLVRFPEESHELSRSGQPRHRIERLTHLLEWFQSHLSSSGKSE